MNDIDHIASAFHLLTHRDSDRFERWKATVNQYQKEQNPVFGRFSGYNYLPIQAFKEAPICCFDPSQAEKVFQSSGTASAVRSKHFVRYLEVYERSLLTGFTNVFGPTPALILAHLPAYEQDSSLVHMAQTLIRELGVPGSGFVLADPSLVEAAIQRATSTGERIIVLGAAFGLLDLIESRTFRMPPVSIIIETGGMKTHRREISRTLLHEKLAKGFSVDLSQIRSEYGMCELLSQCYTNESGLFEAPPWVRFEVMDPVTLKEPVALGTEGVLAIFDLANLYSQSAILTQDIAVMHPEGFEIRGRLNEAEIRGCNLLLEA